MSDVVQESNSHKAVELSQKKEKRKQILEQLENADDMKLFNQLPADQYTSIVERYSSELIRLALEIEALELNNENVNSYLETGLTLVENLDVLFNETDNERKKMLIGPLFTDKLILGNECCQTTNMHEAINVLIKNSEGLQGAKKGKAVKNDSLSVYVPGAGVEPARFPTGV
jgi:site-specific DNA recombinase